MKHQRIITNAEKGAIIEEYLTGEKSSYELAKKYHVSQPSIVRWSQAYKAVNMSSKKSERNKKSSVEPSGDESLELELKRLRKELEAKDFKILVLETTIKKAGELYGVDIKKKLDTK